MNKFSIFIASLLAICVIADVPAQSKRPGSSSSNKSSSSSSRPGSRPPSSSSSKPFSSGSSSKPKSSVGSSSNKPSSRPSSSFPSPSSSSAGTSSKPSKSFDSAASSAQKKDESRKVFESAKKPTPTKPSPPVVSNTPSTKPSSRPSSSFPSPSSSSSGNSSKPSKSFDNAAAVAQKKEESRKTFQTTKPVVTAKPQVSRPVVSKIQTTTTKEEVAQRPQRIEHHYHRYYGDRYTTYRSQPYIDVGGGYSPIFWYAMADWSAERRAMWFYHNQNTINRDLYEQELRKNATLAAEVNRLHTNNTPVDTSYVDKEFVDNPDLMYSDTVVAAAVQPKRWYTSWYFIVPSILLVGFGVYFMFVHDFKVKEV